MEKSLGLFFFAFLFTYEICIVKALVTWGFRNEWDDKRLLEQRRRQHQGVLHPIFY